jgi:transcriptional regulator with XRE-family HTH domain
MRTRDSLAAVLRLARSARRLKVDDFALAVDPRHIQYLETGKVTTTLETLEAVAKVLDVNPISLLVLASSLGTNTSPNDLVKQILADVDQLAALDVNSESFAAQFLDGQLVSRPAGAQVNQKKLAAVLACKNAGMTMGETAKKLEMPATTVRRYWSKI